MELAEERVVMSRQHSFLQIVVICDLINRSTSLSTIGIGLQSLAGLHAYPLHSFDRSLGKTWLQIQGVVKRGLAEASRSNAPQLYKGLLRGGLHPLITCNEMHSDLQQTLKSWRPQHVLTGPILALAYNQLRRNGVYDHEIEVLRDILLAWVLARPFDELLRVHPWSLFQIRNAVRSSEPRRTSNMEPNSPEVSLLTS
jgi:hypothetical protein